MASGTDLSSAAFEHAGSPVGELRTLFPPEPGVISLAVGAPDNRSLHEARSLIADASAKRLAQQDAFMLVQYGPAAGDGRFLSALSDFILRRDSDREVDVRNLMLTTGVTGGVGLAATKFMCAGDQLFTEQYTYFLQLKALTEDLRMVATGIACDENGLDTGALEEHLRFSPPHASVRSSFSAIVYVIPDFSNPSGTVMSEERRRHLARLAAEFNLLVISDDVYRFVRFLDSDSMPPALVEYNEVAGGRIVSVSSFTKLLAPGVRVGWLESSQTMVQALWSSGIVLSGGASNHMMAGIMTQLLESKLIDDYLDMLLQKYMHRKQRLVSELRRSLPSGSVVSDPDGGFFIFITLPNTASGGTLDAAQLAEEAKKEAGVTYTPAIACIPGGLQSPIAAEAKAKLRVSFCAFDEATLAGAAHALGNFLCNKC